MRADRVSRNVRLTSEETGPANSGSRLATGNGPDFRSQSPPLSCLTGSGCPLQEGCPTESLPVTAGWITNVLSEKPRRVMKARQGVQDLEAVL